PQKKFAECRRWLCLLERYLCTGFATRTMRWHRPQTMFQKDMSGVGTQGCNMHSRQSRRQTDKTSQEHYNVLLKDWSFSVESGLGRTSRVSEWFYVDSFLSVRVAE